jgi:UDP-N-acetylmuramate dehydrogenase
MKHRGKLEKNINLARYCTWRVGGNAAYAYSPADKKDLCEFVADEQYAPFTWLGLGSNVLIRDGGIDGTVILTQDVLDDIHEIENQILYVEAGVPCAKIAKLCARLGLVGGEFFA